MQQVELELWAPGVLERLETIPRAAALLGLKAHSLRRAVKRGLVPNYSCFNKRVLVRPSEVLAAIAAGREGQQ